MVTLLLRLLLRSRSGNDCGRPFFSSVATNCLLLTARITRQPSVRPGGAAGRRRLVRLSGRAHLRVPVAPGAPEEPALARRTLVLRLRVHLHVLAEVAGLVELLAAHLAREAARRRPVGVRVRDEVRELAERGAALETAQRDVAAGAGRLVLRLVVQTALARRERLRAQRARVIAESTRRRGRPAVATGPAIPRRARHGVVGAGARYTAFCPTPALYDVLQTKTTSDQLCPRQSTLCRQLYTHWRWVSQ